MKFTCEYNDILKSTVCKGQHESGLKVIVIKTPGFKKSYATFSTKYGSINTKFIVPGESSVTDVTDGIAHFLEHKVFEEPDGTNAFNDFSLYGANANAFTSFGVTNYLFSSTECFEENLKILLGFVQRPYFTEENVEKEKGIIAQEINMYEDDAEQTLFYNCLCGMYKNHPIRKKIAGSVEEIMKITPELLYKCYNTFYHPSNMAVICVGDLDENRIGDIVEQCITEKEPRGEIKQVFPGEPKNAYKDLTTAYFDVPIPMFMLGFKDDQEGIFGRELLKRDILFSALLRTLFGRSSKFYSKLYREGTLNDTFSAFHENEESCGYVIFNAECENYKKVEEEIYKTIENAKENGLDEKEFNRAVKVLLGNFISLLDSVEDLGNDYMFAFHKGADLMEYPQICREITASQAQKLLNEIFVKERSSMSLVLPKEK